jgi:hypothetical protein
VAADGPGPAVGRLNARDALAATLIGPAAAASLAGDKFDAVGCVDECEFEDVFDE